MHIICFKTFLESFLYLISISSTVEQLNTIKHETVSLLEQLAHSLNLNNVLVTYRFARLFTFYLFRKMTTFKTNNFKFKCVFLYLIFISCISFDVEQYLQCYKLFYHSLAISRAGDIWHSHSTSLSLSRGCLAAYHWVS